MATGGQTSTTGSGGSTNQNSGGNPAPMAGRPSQGGAPSTAGQPTVAGQPAVGPCDGKDDGAIVTEGEYGACSYSDDCIVSGSTTRVNRVCEGGALGDMEEVSTEGCERETDETVLNTGEFGECIYADECVETGSKTRTKFVCVDGVATDREETEACADCNRVTNDLKIETGEYGQCEYADACTEQGTKSRTNRVCFGGVQIEQTETLEFPDCA